MGAVDDLIRAKTGDAPAPTPSAGTGPSAVDALIASRKSAPSSGGPNLGTAILGGGKQVLGAVGTVLDAQRAASQEGIFHGGSSDENRHRLRTSLGIESDYQNPKLFGTVAQPELATHLERGLLDTALDTVTDPLTAETLGAGALAKQGVRAGAAVLKAVDATPLGRMFYDFTHWGGAVAREQGPQTVARLRGAANLGSATAMRVQQHLTSRFDTITKGLTDDEKVRVGQALNGEIAYELPGALTPKERTAYRQLRTLTEMDYKMRTDTALAVNFRNLTTDLSAADRALLLRAFRTHKEPPIPKAEPSAKVQPANTPHTIAHPDLRRVESDADKTRYTPEFQAFTNRNGPVKRYDYYQGDKHIGSVEVSFPEGQPPHIEDLETTQNVRRQGFGASMLADVGEHLRSLGHKEVTAAPTNDTSEALNARVWGKPVERATRYNGTSDLHDLEAAAPKIAPTTAYKTPEGNLTSRAFKKAAPNAAAVERATMLNQRYHQIASAVEDAVPKRTDYMPWAHVGEAEPLLGRKAKKIDKTEYFDPRTEHREDVHVTEPGQLRAGFEAMAKNTGRQVKTRIIHENLGALLDDPKIRALFEDTIRATGSKRSDLQKFQDTWLKIIGYPRAATVSLTPRHAANILDLAANTVPIADQPAFFKDTMALAAKIATAKTPRDYAKLTDEGRRLGALSGEFSERAPFFQNVPGLANWTRLNNRLVWAVDEAAKQTYAKLLVARGEATGLEAGGTASARLVDYEHVSPLVKALRYVAPFGTFRGSIPGAVLGGVARNPARAALLNRASGGTMYGGKPDKGQHGLELYNPTADVARGIESPQEYLRATLGSPAQAAGTLAGEAFAGDPGASVRTTVQELGAIPGQVQRREFSQIGKPKREFPYSKAVALRTARFLNYGNPVDLRWLVGAAAAGVLEARDALDELGYGQFSPHKGTVPERLEQDAAQQVLGVGVK